MTYFVYVNLRNDFEAGLYTHEALDYIMDNGAPLITIVEYDEFYPFNLNNHLSSVSKLSSNKIKEAKRNALNFKIKKYSSLSTIDGIKQSISQNHPVVYTLDYIPNSLKELFNCKADDCYWEPKQSDKLEPGSFGGHAVLIVGYDDEKQAIKILNSWGSDFGNNGFFWIKYEDVFSPIIKHPYYPCWIDLGSGYCFSDEDYTLYKDDFTKGEIWSLVKQYERKWDVELPTGNGFGSQAYSIQGIKYDERILWKKEYITQPLKEKCQW